jgi:threonine aldolase
MKIIDLRSDTFTQPTDAMRAAMARAEVGDDVFEEDPTLNRLQDLAAEILGKEAALFVPSGTMGNLVSLLTHCQRGDEVILGNQSHIFLNEVGGMAALGGIHPHPIPNQTDGTLALGTLEQTVRQEDLHFPPTRLVCLENTHNYCNGSPLTPDYMDSIGEFARKHNLKIHLDGARLFNAAVALEVDIRELTRSADSVMVCLSKGLSAPVGSIVAGTGPWVTQARKWRKMVGGGLRQGGHLAAAGILALEDPGSQLRLDHINAHSLATGLSQLPGIELDVDSIRTNILFFTLKHPKVQPEGFLEGLEKAGVKILILEGGRFRAVLNRHVNEKDIATVLSTAESLLS